MPTQADQSQQFDVLMDSVAATLAAGTGMNPRYIIEYWGSDRPAVYEGQQIVLYRLADWNPYIYSGGGRLASLTDVSLSIRVWTTLKSDLAGSTYAWFRNPARGHWQMLFKCLNSFDNNNLFVFDEDGNQTNQLITLAPLQQLPSPFAEQSKDPTYGFSDLLFQVELAKPLYLP